jgi:hypothetical protein
VTRPVWSPVATVVSDDAHVTFVEVPAAAPCASVTDAVN